MMAVYFSNVKDVTGVKHLLRSLNSKDTANEC